jgi:hypothetical protein
VGQSSFRKDQEKLVQKSSGEDVEADLSAAPTDDSPTEEASGVNSANQRGGPVLRELVDILICTPGEDFSLYSLFSRIFQFI